MTTSVQPRTTVNIVGANVAVQNTDQKVLFVGQQTLSGIASGSLVENVLKNQEDTLFGADSMLAQMIRAARELNEVTRFDAIPLDDDGGTVNAEIVVTFTGTATESGEIDISVGSEVNNTYTVVVADTDAADDVGASLETIINADTSAPFTASNTSGVVTITVTNGGTWGNAIGVAFSGTVAGITTALMGAASGAGDPVLTGVFDIVVSNGYQGVAWPYFNDTAEVRTFLDDRFNVVNKVLDGRAVTASVDTLANNLARLNALNSNSLIDIVDEPTDDADFKGPAMLELLPVKASLVAAVRALRLTDGASIGQFVLASNGPDDAFGGPALASKPYFNTPFPQLPLTQTGRGWDDVEIEQLFDAGGSIIGNNVAGNSAIAGELVTTYKTDVAGSPDISFKFLNYVDTISACREYYYNNLRSRFAQSRLTEGDILPGRDMANELTIRAFCEKLYQDLSSADFVLLEAGETALQFFKANLRVTIDKANGIVTIAMIVPIVTQLREINATLQIAFSTQA